MLFNIPWRERVRFVLDRESGQRHMAFYSFGNLMSQGRGPVSPPPQLACPKVGELNFGYLSEMSRSLDFSKDVGENRTEGSSSEK